MPGVAHGQVTFKVLERADDDVSAVELANGREPLAHEGHLDPSLGRLEVVGHEIAGANVLGRVLVGQVGILGAAVDIDQEGHGRNIKDLSLE